MISPQRLAVLPLFLITISTLNIAFFTNPVQASFGFGCAISRKFYIQVITNSHGQLVYKAFNGDYGNDLQRPHGEPDLVLYNGKLSTKKKRNGDIVTVVRWGAAGGYLYQVSVTKFASDGSSGGELLVKQKNKVLHQQECAGI
jgi:hypothetical protein